MNYRRRAILTERMERLKMYPSANQVRGELTPVEKSALAPVMLAIRRALAQFQAEPRVRVELSRSEALALSYALDWTIP
jgi:hypothetical protein